jgi:DNA processing protein
VLSTVHSILALLGSAGLGRAHVRRLTFEQRSRGGDWPSICARVRAAGAVLAPERWVDDQIAMLERERIATIPLGHDSYPVGLAAVPDPPIALFVRGRTEALCAFAIAIVGSRRCSPGAQSLAHQMACDLAGAGATIVSGLAVGVDAAAHRGALAASGSTVAVLGGGHGRMYPRQHRDLGAAIAEAGAVVSEYPPDVPPRRRHFPERNRIVSGLATGVVLIEAGERSGSLITARMALEQGREVMVVPGSPLGGRSRGGHRLIQSGAALVEDADDVLRCLGVEWYPSQSARPPASSDGELARAIPLEHIVTVDELVEHLRWPVPRLLEGLTRLELDGVVSNVDGGYIRRPC